jgi:hypothetical protein
VNVLKLSCADVAAEIYSSLHISFLSSQFQLFVRQKFSELHDLAPLTFKVKMQVLYTKNSNIYLDLLKDYFYACLIRFYYSK